MGTTARRTPRPKRSADVRAAVLGQQGRMPIGKVAHSSSSLVDWQRRTARPMNDRQLPQLSASISTNDRQLHGTAVQHVSKKFVRVFPLQQRRKGT